MSGKRHDESGTTMRAGLRASVLLIGLLGCTSSSNGGLETVDVFAAHASPVQIELEVMTCNAEHRVDVRETSESVEVTVLARGDTPDECADAVTIDLAEPLGTRTLVDAFDDQALTVSRL